MSTFIGDKEEAIEKQAVNPWQLQLFWLLQEASKPPGLTGKEEGDGMGNSQSIFLRYLPV